MDSEFEFEGQHADEKVILIEKQHPWVLVKMIGVIVGVGLIVFFFFLFFHLAQISWIILALAAVFLVFYLFGRIFIYNNNLFILTDQRIIYINQTNLFNRKVSETELNKIYNISYEIKGIIKSLLNFGDIQISTAGDEKSLINLQNFENPHFIYEKINERQKKINPV